VNAAIKAVLAEKMSAEALKQYDAVIFANTTGDLPLPDKEAFLDWIKSGRASWDALRHRHLSGLPGISDMIGAPTSRLTPPTRSPAHQPGSRMPGLRSSGQGLEGVR